MITQLCLKFPIAVRGPVGGVTRRRLPQLEEGAGEAHGPAPRGEHG